MEDLYNKKQNKADYKMAIKNGRFYTYLGNDKPQDMEGVEEIQTTDGRIYYAKVGESFTGKLVNVEITMKEYKGKNMEILNLHFTKNDKKITIEFPFSSKYGRSFLYRMLGINPAQDVTFEPYSFTGKDGKEAVGITILQNNFKLPSLYTKDAPNGMPQPQIVVVNNAQVYDWTESIKFQLGLVAQYNAKANELKTEWDKFDQKPIETAPIESVMPAAKKGKKVQEVVQEDADEDDGLPF